MAQDPNGSLPSFGIEQNMNPVNHIAILVPSVDASAGVLTKLACRIGAREEWEGEGTAEIYVGDQEQTGKILLMEPVKPGAYARAMKKRGPGLHHIAVDVLDLESFVTGLAGSGWYLHPKSLLTIRKTKTAWLSRPGTGMLIDVQQRNVLRAEPSFVSRLELPLSAKERAMIDALRCPLLRPSEDGCTWFIIGQRRIELTEILTVEESE